MEVIDDLDLHNFLGNGTKGPVVEGGGWRGTKILRMDKTCKMKLFIFKKSYTLILKIQTG